MRKNADEAATDLEPSALASPLWAEARPIPLAWELAAVALLLVAGAILRFAQLDTVPPGLWYDEAINGLDALTIWREPGFPLFFMTEGHPREPLYMYLELLGVWTAGTTAEAIRGVSGVIGLLTIPLMWLFGRQLGGWRLGLLSAFLLTFMRWHVHFSRLAFRTILSPMFCLLGAILLVRVIRKRRPLDAALFGALLGLSLYTYLSMRLFLVAAGLTFAGGLLITKTPRALFAKLSAAAAIGFFVVFAPLGINYLSHPEHFSGRQGEISLIGGGAEGWARIAMQTRDVALMGLLRGDHEDKHNIPGPPRFAQPVLWGSETADAAARWEDLRRTAPEAVPDEHGTGLATFDVVTGLLFYLGLGAVIWRFFRERNLWAAFLLLWLGLGALASILSFGAPNLLRLLMLSPLAALLIAVAVLTLNDRLALPRTLRAALVTAFLLWFAAGESYRYFAVYPSHPGVWWSYNSNFAELAKTLAESSTRPEQIVVPDYVATAPTFAFLADSVEGVVPWPPRGDNAPALSGRVWLVLTQPPFPPLQTEGLANKDVSPIESLETPEGLRWAVIVEGDLDSEDWGSPKPKP
ncbi:MAG: glycosyltransferase family 39 protein [Sumerlaeia bacterium]